MDDTNRVEKLLALLLLNEMKGSPQNSKIHNLNLAGFSNVEIADLLQTTPAVVSQGLYTAKKTKSSRKTSTQAKMRGSERRR
jgi:predicted transcriptional regulator